MADVTINAVTGGQIRTQRMLVYTSTTVGYAFFFENNVAGDFQYKKTTDGGATWGSAVNINTANDHVSACAWFDKWTSGNTGTLIHLAYFEATADDVLYRTLDTATDTLGTQRTVVALASAVADAGAFVSITRSRDGRLGIAFDIDNGAETGFYTSDDGVTWSVRANPVEAADDTLMLYPGNASDAKDLWAIYQDASTNELTIKTFDDSANTWSESSAKSMTENTTDNFQFGYAGSVRHSDGNLIVAYMSTYDSSTNFNVFRWDGSAITDLTALVSAGDDIYWPGVCVDQNTDDLYVSYLGKRDGSQTINSAVTVNYAKSTDDGANWTAGDTAYMQGGAATLNWNTTTLQGPLFAVGWYAGGNFATNAVNAVDISGGGAPAGHPAVKRAGGVSFMHGGPQPFSGRSVW